MTIFGVIFVVIGLVALPIGAVMILRVAYRKSFGLFFACLFFPPVILVLLACHFRETILPFTVWASGWIAVSLAHSLLPCEAC